MSRPATDLPAVRVMSAVLVLLSAVWRALSVCEGFDAFVEGLDDEAVGKYWMARLLTSSSTRVSRTWQPDVTLGWQVAIWVGVVQASP